MAGEKAVLQIEAAVRDDATKALKAIGIDVTELERRSNAAFRDMRAGWGATVIVLNQGAALLSKMARGAESLGRAMLSPIQAAGEQEQATIRMTGALRILGLYTEENVGLLEDQAAALQQATRFGDEAILGLQALLLQFGELSVGQLPRATKATLDFAEATGKNLREAGMAVANALSGTNGTIEGTKIAFDAGAQGAERFEAVMGALEGKVGGFAEMMAGTFLGGLDQAKNAWGDLTEAAGNFVIKAPAAQALIEGITEALQDWTGQLNAASGDAETMEEVNAKLAGVLSAMVGIVGGLGHALLFVGEVAVTVAEKLNRIPGFGVPLNEEQRRIRREIEATEEALAQAYGPNAEWRTREEKLELTKRVEELKAQYADLRAETTALNFDAIAASLENGLGLLERFIAEGAKRPAPADPLAGPAEDPRVQVADQVNDALVAKQKELTARITDEVATMRDVISVLEKEGYERDTQVAWLRWHNEMVAMRANLEEGAITRAQWEEWSVARYRIYALETTEIEAKAQAERTREAEKAAQDRTEAERKAALEEAQLARERADFLRDTNIELLQAQALDAKTQVELLRQTYQQDVAAYRGRAEALMVTEEEMAAYLTARHERMAREIEAINGGMWAGARQGMEDYTADYETNAQFAKRATGELANAVETGFGDAFVSAVDGTKSVKEAFSEMTASILADLARMFAQRAAASLIASLFGGGSEVPANAMGGVYSGRIISTIPFAHGGIMPGEPVDFRSYAGGGVARRPTMALFAERPGMAEAFVPLPDGKNIPAVVDLKGAGGPSFTIQVNQTIQATDAQSFRNQLASNPDVFVGAIVEALRSQPGFRQAIQQAAGEALWN